MNAAHNKDTNHQEGRKISARIDQHEGKESGVDGGWLGHTSLSGVGESRVAMEGTKQEQLSVNTRKSSLLLLLLEERGDYREERECT